MQNQGFDNIQYYKTGGSNPNVSKDTRPKKTGHRIQYNSAQGQIYSTPSPHGVMVTQQTTVVPATAQNNSNWMVPAIFVTLFCFWPTGIFAIVNARRSKHAAQGGDLAGAASYAQKAKTFVIVSIVLGIIVIISIVARFVYAYSS
ncbi:trafficking regulator of GLUT4 1-like [Saccostrea echinata]|uniref:trafficking regulator of GLUT4 1-like n=1 Tax=Saccostrea echinata TaxID=191078 RepID=UPI002A7F23A6|nr:trafficking regulator of GLUT4 1-like [Saccostrea echinata]